MGLCTQRPTREDLLRALVESRRLLLEAVASLPHEELERPQAIGGWSIKDLLAHVASWDELQVKFLQRLKARRGWPRRERVRDLRSFKERQVERKRSLSLTETIENLRGARELLSDEISTLSEEELDRTVRPPWDGELTLRDFLLQNGPLHEQRHYQEVLRFRQSLGR